MNFPVVQLLTKEAQYTSDSRFSPLSLSADCGRAGGGGCCRFFSFFLFCAGALVSRKGRQFVISSLPLDGIFSAAPRKRHSPVKMRETSWLEKDCVCSLSLSSLFALCLMDGRRRVRERERWDCRRTACNFIKRQLVDLSYVKALFLFFPPQRADFYGAVGRRPRGQFLDHRFFTWLSKDEWRDLLWGFKIKLNGWKLA